MAQLSLKGFLKAANGQTGCKSQRSCDRIGEPKASSTPALTVLRRPTQRKVEKHSKNTKTDISSAVLSPIVPPESFKSENVIQNGPVPKACSSPVPEECLTNGKPAANKFKGFEIVSDPVPKKRASATNLSSFRKKFARLDNDTSQNVLDAGQKQFGPVFCDECKMLYVPTHREDALVHEKYHDEHRFSVEKPRKLPKCLKLTKAMWVLWEKHVTPLSIFSNCSIYRLPRKVPVSIRKRVEEACEVVNGELGFAPNFESRNLEKRNREVFMVLSSADVQPTVTGVAIVDAEIRTAFRLISSADDLHNGRFVTADRLSDKAESADIGVNRIWVHPEWRRKGIAQRLLDAVRFHLYYGATIPKSRMAFSQPTVEGRLLADFYFGGLRNVLIYEPS